GVLVDEVLDLLGGVGRALDEDRGGPQHVEDGVQVVGRGGRQVTDAVDARQRPAGTLGRGREGVVQQGGGGGGVQQESSFEESEDSQGLKGAGAPSRRGATGTRRHQRRRILPPFLHQTTLRGKVGCALVVP